MGDARADAVVAEELVLVEHAFKNSAQAVLGREREQTAVALSSHCALGNVSSTNDTVLAE